MRSIDRHGLPAKVLENPLDHRRFLDAGDDAQPAAASPANLDVDGEYALEALSPGHPPLPTCDRCFGTFSDGRTAGGGLTPWVLSRKSGFSVSSLKPFAASMSSIVLTKCSALSGVEKDSGAAAAQA